MRVTDRRNVDQLDTFMLAFRVPHMRVAKNHGLDLAAWQDGVIKPLSIRQCLVCLQVGIVVDVHDGRCIHMLGERFRKPLGLIRADCSRSKIRTLERIQNQEPDARDRKI